MPFSTNLFTDSNSVDYLKRLASVTNGGIFILEESSGRSLALEEFNDAAARGAQLLQTWGLKKGHRLAVIGNNSLDLAILYFSCLFSGVVVIPISPLLTERQIAFVLSTSRAKALALSADVLDRISMPATACEDIKVIFLSEDYRCDYSPNEPRFSLDVIKRSPRVEPYKEVLPDDELIIVYTSGTTAEPKGVVHRISNLVDNARAFSKIVGLNADNRFFNLLPMTYLGGYYNLLLIPYLNRASVVLAQPFGSQSMLNFWEPIIRSEVNTLWLVPTIVSMLLEIDRSQKGVEYCKSKLKSSLIGTAPLSVELRDKFEDRYGVFLLENYGLSETLFISTTAKSDRGATRGVGKLLPDVEVSTRFIGEEAGRFPETEGEILCRTPFLMKGYLDSSTGSTSLPCEDGWFPTGDVGLLSESRRLFITGRKKDLIIRGGLNVSPASIENVVYGVAGVVECVAVGVPDKIMGEEIAVVVRTEHAANFEAVRNRISSACRAELASNQQPRVILQIDAFPYTSSGKIQKAKVREWAKLVLDEKRNSL